MKQLYKLLANGWVQRLSDGAQFEAGADNKDSREYQAWVEQGGEAQPADPEPEDTPRVTLADVVAVLKADAAMNAKLDALVAARAKEKI